MGNSECLHPSLLHSLRASVSYPARRVAALEAKQKPNTPQSHGLTQQDQVIAERLARLRQENKPSEWGQTGWKRRYSGLVGLGFLWISQGFSMPIAESVPSQAEIEARLLALRDAPQGSIPSTQEMEARLAALQGRVPPSQTPQLVSAVALEGWRSWDEDPAEAQIRVCLDTLQEYLLLLRPAARPRNQGQAAGLDGAGKSGPLVPLGTARPT